MTARPGIRSTSAGPRPEAAPAAPETPLAYEGIKELAPEAESAFLVEALNAYRGTLLGLYSRIDGEASGLNPPPREQIAARKQVVLDGIAKCDFLIEKHTEASA